jgi:hypothetical protein
MNIVEMYNSMCSCYASEYCTAVSRTKVWENMQLFVHGVFVVGVCGLLGCGER